MSPLDSNKQVPNLRGEDGEGSVQVQMDPKMKILRKSITPARIFTNRYCFFEV